MISFDNARICFIGAHPDDIELGCGALITNINQRFRLPELLCVTLSKNLNNRENKSLLGEHIQSLTWLKIPKENIILGDFITRTFSNSRQEICDYLFKLNEKYQPDIVFTHSFTDIHQDHEVVSKEVLRIFRQKTIICFEIVPSSYNYAPNFFYEVSEEDVENKLKALMSYKTYRNKNYFLRDSLTAQLLRNGVAIKKKYAEAFEIIRLSYMLQEGRGSNERTT